MNVAPSQAIALIKSFEGCRLEAYQDVGDIWTIGWGHTGPEVTSGLIWSQEQADNALAQDVQNAYDKMCELVKVPLTENQSAALTDFTYNLGAEELKNSTLLMYLNQGLYDKVPEQMVRFCHVKGKMINGLVERRTAEVEMWIS